MAPPLNLKCFLDEQKMKIRNKYYLSHIVTPPLNLKFLISNVFWMSFPEGHMNTDNKNTYIMNKKVTESILHSFFP